MKYEGKDNQGEPKTDYLQKLVNMSDDELRRETTQKIWLSAYATNNLRSDYHWHCDACYDECKRRSRLDIYEKAYESALDQ